MQFHWLRCRDAQGDFIYYYISGKHNLADYWKKYHPESHHIENRYELFTPTCQLELLKSAKAQTVKRVQSQISVPHQRCSGLGNL